MRIHLSVAIVVVFGMFCTQAPVWGQARTMLGGSSTSGGSLSTSGRTFGSGTTASTRDTASASVSQLQQTMGQQLSTLSTLMTASQQRGAFVGGSSSEMQGFAGSQQAGQTTQQSVQPVSLAGQGGQGTLNRGGTTGRGTTGRGATGRGNARGRGTTTQFRSTIRVGFSRAVVAPTQVSTALAQRLSSSRRIQTVSPMEVVIQGRTATLRGVVASDYDRALAEQVARLEAGIGQVRNELVVAVAPAEPELPGLGEAPAEPLVVPSEPE